jgi:uncharacterized protein
MKLPDVNVLIYACNAHSAQQATAARWLEASVARGPGLALTWTALIGFVRVSTRVGVFESPLSVKQAFQFVEDWINAPGSRLVGPGPRHHGLLQGLLLQVGTAGNLTTDAHLAAVALEHGAAVGTFDRDFRRFQGVQVDWLGEPPKTAARD